MAEIPVPSVQVQFCQASISCHFCLLRHQSTPSILPPNPRVQLLKAVFATLSPAEQGAASFAKFSLIGRYLSKSVGTTHVPVQEFALQLFCRHLYQYICYCQYFSLVPLDPRELCERGCSLLTHMFVHARVSRTGPRRYQPPDQDASQDCGVVNTGLVAKVPRSLVPGTWPTNDGHRYLIIHKLSRYLGAEIRADKCEFDHHGTATPG